MPQSIHQFHVNDNVAVAFSDIAPGKHPGFIIRENIPAKHKVILEDLSIGDEIRLFGVPVGRAKVPILSGSLLSPENTGSLDAPLQFSWNSPPPHNGSYRTDRKFSGIVRPDGRVGTANYWLLVPLVFCETRNTNVINTVLNRTLGYEKQSPYEKFASQLLGRMHNEQPVQPRAFPHLDGIRSLVHQGGCGGTREDAEELIRLLLAYVHHPNVAGATVLALGCENAQMQWFQQLEQELYPGRNKPVIYVHHQDLGTEEAFIRTAIEKTISAIADAPQPQRQELGLDKLIIGLECGGSDGFSAITANPLVGRISDRVTSAGGTTILAEFPELHGMEGHLMNRCESESMAHRFFELQRAYKRRLESVGVGFDSNPSPGNIREGLITSEMKSIGAVAKAGRNSISGVLDYLDPVKRPGLQLLCTPGNDVESTTALVASGANVILFTTGLGTPTGNPIVPVIKISSNSTLKERMPDVIDFDAGILLESPDQFENTTDRLEEFLAKTASGKSVKAMNLEQYDFIPWKRGFSL